MLHMLVNVHNPESCAFRSEADDEALSPGFDRLESIAAERGAEMRDAWVNTGSHAIFVLLEAPNAHVIDEILREAGLTGRTHSQVYAVGSVKDLEVTRPQ